MIYETSHAQLKQAPAERKEWRRILQVAGFLCKRVFVNNYVGYSRCHAGKKIQIPSSHWWILVLATTPIIDSLYSMNQ